MENGRCSCGLLRAYPLPREFPLPGRGRAEWVGAELGARPSPTPGAWLSLESLSTAGHHHLPTHSPVTSPTAGSLTPEGGPAVLQAGRSRGHLARCMRAGVCFPGLASHVLLPNFALSRTLPPPASFSITLLLLPVTFRLFRVQCSAWLSSHQATGRNTDEK